MFAGVLGYVLVRLIVFGMLVVGTFTAVRHYYVNKGWQAHKAAVERQDNIAISASREVQKRTDKCTAENGFWDVITQDCKLMDEETKK